MKLNFFMSILLLAFFFIPLTQLFPQKIEARNKLLSGNLILDSKLVLTNYEVQPNLNLQSKEKKSRWLGGAMSLILPGAGEFYAGDYLKAAIFVVVEAAAITTALVYTNKGDSKTQDFQHYADQHWSVKRYAQWTLDHTQYINPDVNPQNYHVFNGDGSVNWSELNRLESDLGDGYSHMLPTPGQQQYYELIGKYPQFSHGWDTSNQNDTDFHILTDQFLWYAHQRGLANDYYTTGNTAIIFIYVNHFLSTLDAVWSVDKYNDSIAMNIRMNGINTANGIQLIPTINLSYNF